MKQGRRERPRKDISPVLRLSIFGHVTDDLIMEYIAIQDLEERYGDFSAAS